MIRLGSADDRFRTEHDGITSWHSFSAGAHYDPERLGSGPVVGCDEHLVAPGAGFDWHAHRGVRIYSWVLEGMLRHDDGSGPPRCVGPGELLAQHAGDGIRHAETNASGTAALRFVQLTLLDSGPPARVGVEAGLTDRRPAFVYVARGSFTQAVLGVLRAGDWLGNDGAADGLVTLAGAGELLVVDP